MRTLTTFWIMLLGVSVFISGCDDKSHHTDALSAKIGYPNCFVYLNRQIIGEISNDSATPLVVNSQGLIYVSGTLKQVTKEWIVLEADVFNTIIGEGQMTLWIPRNVVLFVRTDFNKTSQ